MSDLEETLQKERRKAEERAAKRRAEDLNLSFLSLTDATTPTETKAMDTVPEEDAREALLVPVQLVSNDLIIAAYNPQKEEAKRIIDELKKDYKVKVAITTMSDLKHAWSFYRFVKEKGKEITGAVTLNEDNLHRIQKKINTLADLQKEVGEGEKKPQTTAILEAVLGGSLSLKASDVHLDPEKETSTLKVRIDGMLRTVTDEIKNKTHQSVVSRVKLLSGLKLNVTDEPQDGRFTVELPDREIEIRTSIIPSERGETVVMRLLDPLMLKTDLEELGWREDDLAIVKKEIKKPNGLILNTGPTGSGKTTTLYAFLKKVHKPEMKVITIEDPIEYHLEDISQTQVDRDAKYDFASGLRSILRQDPDVILVGEIRDEETTRIALNAALTGHLVFSTLHTNEAVGTIPRLLDLDAEPNILGPSLNLVIAQRLVRLLCNECKVSVKTKEGVKEDIEKFLESLPDRVDTNEYKEVTMFRAGEGCKECNNTGYHGRTGIFELLSIGDEMEELIHGSPTIPELVKAAKKQGMVEMQEDGILKILKGETSIDEVERLTGEIEWLSAEV